MSEEIKFKDAIKRLEGIVRELEDGVDDLDMVVKLFEEGTELVGVCRKKISDVETKIETLSNKISAKEQPSI